MKALTFTLTPQQFDNKLAALRQAIGNDLHEVTATSGIAKHSGVEAHYAYTPDVLTVNIDHKPWIVGEKTIEAKLSEWFAL